MWHLQANKMHLVNVVQRRLHDAGYRAGRQDWAGWHFANISYCRSALAVLQQESGQMAAG